MISVSDHAVLRELERKQGVDVDRARDRMEKALDTPGARRLIEFAGDVRYKIKVDGDVFCMVGNTVATFWRDCGGSSGQERRWRNFRG